MEKLKLIFFLLKFLQFKKIGSHYWFGSPFANHQIVIFSIDFKAKHYSFFKFYDGIE